MAASPGSMQLRYLQTLADMSNQNASTIVFPLPIEIMESFSRVARNTTGDVAD
ncbi:MAG: hypothetical protein ACI87W_003594 [Halieaceae bacterium]|jgi:hypothetical protein